MPDEFTSITVRPLSGNLGAEIAGVDLSQALTNAQFSEIRDAFHRHSVIVFRNQDIDPDDHLAFARRWGEINVNRFFTPVEGYPMVAEVRKEPDQTHNIGSGWHTDHSYDVAPALGSILVAREVPDFGGDTLFSSMYMAYDALSPGLQKVLEGLKAWHSSRHVFGNAEDSETNRTGRIGNADQADQDTLHPMVITHPSSGRKALYVNPEFTAHIDGWSQKESDALLGYLYQHGANPHFTCRLSWTEGALAMWDNRATWHCALNDYPGQRRLMHRITVEGEPLH
ncbi:MAG: TauD/TfdA dioxygenase family protein [Aestuariivirgaceae bacterium]